MIGYLRLPLSWIAHSDRVGIPLMRVEAAARRDDPAKPARGLYAKGVADIAKASASLIEGRIGEAGARVPPLTETPALRARAIVAEILRRRGRQL
jgi:hypothetical protein